MVKDPLVVSISRRTDIPRFYWRWLARALKAGFVAYQLPYGGKREVSLRPEAVHSLVFWSKDYSRLLGDPDHGEILAQYSLYFQFSVTGLGGTPMEPGVPPTGAALEQMARLAQRWEPERVAWRFDPIVYWLESSGQRRSNLGLFQELAPRVAALGIRKCVFSFTHWYGKAVRRAARRAISWVDPEAAEKLEAVAWMDQLASRLGLSLESCAQPQWASIPGVAEARCIDGVLLSRLHPQGLAAPTSKDKGQRTECQCTPSVDIGSYTQPCPHACVYCYALTSDDALVSRPVPAGQGRRYPSIHPQTSVE